MTDPTGGQSAATGDGQSAVTGNQGTGTAADAGGQSATGTTATTTPESGQSTVPRAEFDQLRAQLAAADQKRVAAEQAHAQLRDKDMPALEKLQRDLTESQAAVTAMKAANEALRVQNAFLTSNEHEWHSPEAALRLLDLSKVTVDADGNVQGMRDALQALATAHPYLLKPKPAADDAGSTVPPTVSPANGGIAPQAGTKPDNRDLVRRFPALQQRLGQ